jgi:transcription elongation GreA/GreB family factor
MIDPARLREAIIRELSAELDRQLRAARLAHDEATHEESRPENKYDTHAQEASYLAEGQARQAAEVRASLQLYHDFIFPGPAATVAMGHVVQLAGDTPGQVYLLGPRAGGLTVTVDNHQIVIVTPASPLGRQLPGARLGQEIHLPGRPARICRLAAIA